MEQGKGVSWPQKTTEKHKESRIDIEDFREIYKTLAHRAELRELFHAFSSNGTILPDHHLAQFLRNEQYEADATEETAFEIILKYEPVEEVRRRRQMSFEGFIRYMNSEECLIFQNEHRSIYQDMTQPLCDYFISSAHNLISDQLIGPSDLWAYTSALLKGCRCLEIDCWDGSNNEPVVCHGHTLRRKILFRSVIAVIGKYAFVVSDYPVILSLENHCSPKQQEVMAHYLETILGDRLLTSKAGRATMTKLPSPEDLKFKILVKTKRKGRTKQRMHRRGLGSHHETEKISEKFKHFSYEDQPGKKMYKIPASSKKAASKRSDSVTEAPPRKMAKMKRTKIGIPLSDLVIYTKSKRLVNFDHSLKNQKCYENNSIEEVRARKLIKDSARKFISHTTRFITRIHPKGTRTKSCNYNPQEFWNLGCQMVALNFQTLGVQMDLQHGKFLDNGGCGYILKPEFLRNPSSTFTPDNVRRYSRPVSLSIKLISGHQLPPSSLSKTNKADPLVHIEIYGVPEDQAKRKSSVIKCNAFSPRWDETLSFLVHIPELALIRFCVEDEISLVAKEFLGQYTLPLTSLSKGYHTVPLFSKDGGSLKPASLFVHVWYCE